MHIWIGGFWKIGPQIRTTMIPHPKLPPRCCFILAGSLQKTKTTDIAFDHPASLYEPRHEKTNKMSVRPAKIQISLCIRPVWPESSLCAQWVAKDPSFLHADSEDSDETGRKPRLIWVFAGRTLILLVLSCHGSNIPTVILGSFKPF